MYLHCSNLICRRSRQRVKRSMILILGLKLEKIEARETESTTGITALAPPPHRD